MRYAWYGMQRIETASSLH